jgi:hypothetical protein
VLVGLTAVPALAAVSVPLGVHPRAVSAEPRVLSASAHVAQPYATGSTVKGKVTVTYAISVLSAVPTSTPVLCSISLQLVDETNFYFKTVSVQATRSGSTASCTVPVPYAFYNLQDASSDQLAITSSITAGSTTLASDTQPVTTEKLPANNATGSFSEAATL